jgi:hypothetical protein
MNWLTMKKPLISRSSASSKPWKRTAPSVWP